MTFASGLFCQTFVDALDVTGLALDLGAEDHKVALFSNTPTPDFSAVSPVPAYGAAPFDANEITGTGYTVGGATLTTTTLTVSAGVVVFDAADVSWAASTLSGVRGCLIYADALAGKNAILAVTFGADFATSNGTLLVQWSGSGIATIDLVP